MDIDSKLNMSLDQLIKTDSATKQAVKSGNLRGRGRRNRAPGASAPASNKPTVKKDINNNKSEKNNKRNRKPQRPARKDSDVDMKDNSTKRPTKVPVKKVILTTKKEAQKVVHNDRRKVRITNIPYDVTWRDVKDAFSKVAKVERCDVEKGEATILFATHDDALKAISTYNGGNMNGRVIKAFFD